MIDLSNKVVKVPNVGFLSYFFPEYTIANEYLPFVDKVIFTGSPQEIRKFRNSGTVYIGIYGVPEYDLTNREKCLQFVYSKFDKEPPKYLMETKDLYDDNTFFEYCKLTWITGVWPEKIEEQDITIYNLYQSLTQGTSKANEVLFELLKTTSPEIIEASLLTFLTRIKSLDDQSVSVNYKKILLSFKNAHEKNVKPSVERFVFSKLDNTELRLFEFINNLISR